VKGKRKDFENIIDQLPATETNRLSQLKITHRTSKQTTDEIPSYRIKCPRLLRTLIIKSRKHKRMINHFHHNSEIHWQFKIKLWFQPRQVCISRSLLLPIESKLLSTWMRFLNLARKSKSMLLSFPLISCQLDKKGSTSASIWKTSQNLLVMSSERRWTSYPQSLLIKFRRKDRCLRWMTQTSTSAKNEMYRKVYFLRRWNSMKCSRWRW
jgi:hypothetical protein